MMDNTSDQVDLPSVNSSDILFYHAFYQVTIPALFGMTTVVGVIGNLLVLFVVMSRHEMRQNSVNLLLLNLAISDLILLLICIPFFAYHYTADNWLIGDVTCKLSNFLFYVTTYVTVYTLVVISVVRVRKIAFSGTGNKNASLCRERYWILLTIALLWSTVCLANIPVANLYRVKSFPIQGIPNHDLYFYCGLENIAYGQQIFLSFFLLAYLAPLVAIASLYLFLLRYIKSRPKRLEGRQHYGTTGPEERKRHGATGLEQRGREVNNGECNSSCSEAIEKRRNSRVTQIVCSVVLVFAACWLPLHVHLLLVYFRGPPQSRVYEIYRGLSQCLAYANSCFNPVIYSYVSTDFRRHFRSVFSSAFSCCRRQPDAQNNDVMIEEAGVELASTAVVG